MSDFIKDFVIIGVFDMCKVVCKVGEVIEENEFNLIFNINGL